MKKRPGARIHPVPVLTVSLVGILLLSTLAQAESSGGARRPPPSLPPRPPVNHATPEPLPVEAGPEVGSAIRLEVQYSQDWPWSDVHWQAVWTFVQWQDPWGDWHDVEGWKGDPDEVKILDDGTVVSYKTWWVNRGDMGKGPFRWLVSYGQGGPLLATSEPFYLPEFGLVTIPVEVSLTQ